MLSVILSILKIIGIILLAIVGFVIFIVLLVLFVPVRYRLISDNKENIKAKLKISWLLNFISVTVEYDKKINAYVKVLFLKIYDYNKKKLKSESLDESNIKETINVEDVKKAGDAHIVQEESIGTEEQLIPQEELIPEEETESKKTIDFAYDDSFDNTSNEDIKKKISLKERIKDLIKKIQDFLEILPDKLEEFSSKPFEKLESISNTIEYYSRILNSKGTEYVIEYVKKRIINILKNIRPRKSKINISYSSIDHPERIGMIYEWYGILFPFLPKNTYFNGGFDEDSFSYELDIKGHITVAIIAYNGILLLFNKKVRKFIKLMKREEHK